MENDLENELQDLNIKKDSIEEIENFLSKKLLGHVRTTLKISPKGLFRARIINNIEESQLATPECIWYPDWKKIPTEKYRFGRLTNKGQNFFYSSNYLGATIKELRPNNGDRILIGIFNLKFAETKIKSQFAGIEAVRNTNLFSLLNDFEYASEKDEIIEKFISEKFQEKVEEIKDYKYKLTIAFSNILLKNPEIGCLIYPSVASNLNYINFGIKPEIIDKYFYCQSMYIYAIKKDNKGYTLVPEKFVKEVIPNENGAKHFELKWKELKERDKKRFIRYSL